MYFFDIEDYCNPGFPVIGANAQNIFNAAIGTICEDIGSTYRATRDSLYGNVNQWYNLANPYSNGYKFSENQTLTWPSSTSTYTLYTGGFTSNDDGYSNTPITLPTTYSMNGVDSTSLYVSTNGYFTIGQGRGIIDTSPVVGPPSTLCANPGDNWLQPGTVLSDTTTQNLYYKTGYDGRGRHNVKLLVYGGVYNNITTPTSWVGNFYRDSYNQWLEVMIKPTSVIRGSAGPYNSNDVSSPPSTLSKVWKGDLNGKNWVYMGEGTVTIPGGDNLPVRVCPECDNIYNNFISTYNSLSFFWGDDVNNFQNITLQQYQTFIETTYENMDWLKSLLKCVDGDDFEDFVI